jgi:hypothetical protein
VRSSTGPTVAFTRSVEGNPKSSRTQIVATRMGGVPRKHDAKANFFEVAALVILMAERTPALEQIADEEDDVGNKPRARETPRTHQVQSPERASSPVGKEHGIRPNAVSHTGR